MIAKLGKFFFHAGWRMVSFFFSIFLAFVVSLGEDSWIQSGWRKFLPLWKKNIRTSFFLKKKTLRSSGPTKWPNHCYFKCQRVFTTPTMIQVDPEKTSMPRCPRCLREQLHCPMPKGTLAATGHGTVSCVQQVAWMWQGGWLHQVDSEVVKISCKKFQRWRKIRTTKNTSHLTTATVHPEIFTRKLHRIKKSHNNTSHQLGCILEPKVTTTPCLLQQSKSQAKDAKPLSNERHIP